MQENVSFIFNNVNIYNDCCLVEDDVPIFFTCKDDQGNYYLALCVDMDSPRYNVIQVTTLQLNNMLHGIISMREIFTVQEFYWEVTPIDENIENDIIKLKNMADIDCDDLPDENAYFELFSEDLKKYAKAIGIQLVSKEFSCTLISRGDFKQERFDYLFENSGDLFVYPDILIECYTETNRKLNFQNVNVLLKEKEKNCAIDNLDCILDCQDIEINDNITTPIVQKNLLRAA